MECAMVNATIVKVHRLTADLNRATRLLDPLEAIAIRRKKGTNMQLLNIETGW
jgi:hypothetical protein